MATPRLEGRPAWPSRHSTPGDLAPMALDDFVARSATPSRLPPELPRAPALPCAPCMPGGRLMSTACSLANSWDAPACSLANSWDGGTPLSGRPEPVADQLSRSASAAISDTLRDSRDAREVRDRERERERERELERRIERRLQELGLQMDGLAEEGQAAWRRLDEVEESQRILSGDIKSVAAMADSLSGSVEQSHVAEVSSSEFSELRKDVRALSQALSAVQETAQSAGADAALQEAERRVEAQGRRVSVLAGAVSRQWLRQQPSFDQECKLRDILLHWHEVVTSSSQIHAVVAASQGAVNSRPAERHAMSPALLENVLTSGSSEQALAELRGVITAGLNEHERRFAKVDEHVTALMHGAGLSGVDANTGAHSASISFPPARTIKKIQELFECVDSQAKAVGDLQYLVSEELRAAREATEEARANQQRPLDQMREDLVEQARAIESLRGDDGSLPSRVSELEQGMDTMRTHLGSLVAVVRQVRDHAADAFDDRVAVAMAEVQRRMVGCITTAHGRVKAIRQQVAPNGKGSEDDDVQPITTALTSSAVASQKLGVPVLDDRRQEDSAG